jgi:hypothetical protein
MCVDTPLATSTEPITHLLQSPFSAEQPVPLQIVLLHFIAVLVWQFFCLETYIELLKGHTVFLFQGVELFGYRL